MNTKINNRIIRVFVSSTFSDMNEERQYLMEKVFPQLKEMARRRNVTFVELDLRWGIREEDTHNGKVLQYCLDAIRDSKPFFIGIVGNRVGWCPTMEELSRNPIILERYPDVLKDIESGASATEIEMQYAVLRNPEKMHAFFYFRKHNEPLDDKIKRLRNKIRESKYHVYEYSDKNELGEKELFSFGEDVKQQFCNLLDELYPITTISNSLYEHKAQIDLIERLSSGFIDYNHMEDLILNPESENLSIRYWALVGETGIGKTSLLAHWIQNNRNKNDIIPCFIGSTHLNSSLSIIKDYLRKEIEALFGSSNIKTMCFEESLKQIPLEHHVLFVIDGIDNLKITPEEIYTFLASFSRYCQSCKVMFSLEKGSKVEEQLHHLKARFYEQKNLTEDRLVQLGTCYLKTYNKELEKKQLQHLTETEMCSNPLVFKTILNEIIAIGTHETNDKLIADYAGAKSVVELYDKILVRFEKSYGVKLVAETMSLIANSPQGLTENEITDIINPKPIDWAPLFYAATPFLSVVNNCLIINNTYLINAIENRYKEKNYWSQKELLSYFENKLKEEITCISDGKDQWVDRATDILKMGLSPNEATIHTFSEKIVNHPDVLGRINRYVSLYTYLSYNTNDYSKLEAAITTPLCYLSSAICDERGTNQYIQYLKLKKDGFDLSPLIDLKRYPRELADLIYPDICVRVGRQSEEILHDTNTTIKAYEKAIEFWDERGYSITSDFFVFTTYNYLLALYLSLQRYDRVDSLYEIAKKRFFAKKDWAPEYKAGIVANYIRSLEKRGLMDGVDQQYELALSFIAEINMEEVHDYQKAQLLHQRGNMYIERAISETIPEDIYKFFWEQSNNCICESMDLFKKLDDINPYKYRSKYLEVRYDLANLHHDTGNREMALSLFESIYSEFDDNLKVKDYKSFYTEDEVILKTMYSLSFMYNDLGKYEKAEELLNKVFKVREFQFSENETLFADEIALCAYEKARLYGRMGMDIKIVEHLYNKAIQCYSRLMGKYPEIAKTYASMAFAFQRVQSYEKAVYYYTKARETWQKYGEQGFPVNEARLAEIYFQEAQCAIACNDREHFGECMIKSYDIYERLSKINPAYMEDFNRVTNYMQELLKINGLI